MFAYLNMCICAYMHKKTQFVCPSRPPEDGASSSVYVNCKETFTFVYAVTGSGMNQLTSVSH